MSSTNINAWPYAYTCMIIYHLCFNLVLSDPRVCCFWTITLQSICSRGKNSLWAMYSITSEHFSQKHAWITDLQWVKNWTFLEVYGWHVINLAIPPSLPQTKTFHTALSSGLFSVACHSPTTGNLEWPPCDCKLIYSLWAIWMASQQIKIWLFWYF